LILVAGASGRLGRALMSAAGDGVRPLPSAVRESEHPEAILDELRPAAVVNAAALSSAGECAASPMKAMISNAIWPKRLAAGCSSAGIRLIHVSSDMVYSGGNAPYAEGSIPVPASVYGWSKLLGDALVAAACPEALTVRTSVLFGSVGAPRPTFSEDLLSGAVRSLHVDSWRNHTSISWFARRLVELCGMGVSGLLIVCSRDSTSRSAFGETFLRACGRSRMPPAGYRPAGVPGDLTMIPALAERTIGRQMPGLDESIAFETAGIGPQDNSAARKPPV